MSDIIGRLLEFDNKDFMMSLRTEIIADLELMLPEMLRNRTEGIIAGLESQQGITPYFSQLFYDLVRHQLLVKISYVKLNFFQIENFLIELSVAYLHIISSGFIFIVVFII